MSYMYDIYYHTRNGRSERGIESEVTLEYVERHAPGGCAKSGYFVAAAQSTAPPELQVIYGDASGVIWRGSMADWKRRGRGRA